MGANSSRESPSVSYRNYDSPNGYPQPQAYNPYDQTIPPQLYPPHSNPSQNTNHTSNWHHHNIPLSNRKRLKPTYSKIADEYKTLEEVTTALVDAGLESSNLIVGIDFTKSNEWTGKTSFNRLNLHHIGKEMNPYEQAISIVGRTLSSYDEDNLIPCFGFGDVSTHNQDVFSFYSDGRPCNGLEEVLSRYREIIPHIRLSGPTSFAPMIEMATTIVEETGGQYHVLLIIADGQVTRIPYAEPGRFSLQEQRTLDAIARASEYPLSIVLVGVGDGPWDMMKDFDDHVPVRAFDNFQFVNFTEIMLKNTSQMRKEKEFALRALMKIPQQFTATLDLHILGRQNTDRSPGRIALPTPNGRHFVGTSSFAQSNSIWTNSTVTAPITSSAAALVDNNKTCAVCFVGRKDMAFGCGHRTCHGCGPALSNCPICRRSIDLRIKLY